MAHVKPGIKRHLGETATRRWTLDTGHCDRKDVDKRVSGKEGAEIAGLRMPVGVLYDK